MNNEETTKKKNYIKVDRIRVFEVRQSNIGRYYASCYLGQEKTSRIFFTNDDLQTRLTLNNSFDLYGARIRVKTEIYNNEPKMTVYCYAADKVFPVSGNGKENTGFNSAYYSYENEPQLQQEQEPETQPEPANQDVNNEFFNW